MRKLTANEIKEELVTIETIIDFGDLDSFMTNNGYYSVLDDGVIEAIKRDKNIVYTAIDSNEHEVQVFFEIVIDNGEDEAEEAFILRVTDVQEF